jgi:hypothetical protein
MAFVPELSASKVAGFLGLHKYQDPAEIAYELLCKHPLTKARITALEVAQGRRPYQAVVNEVLREGPILDCVSNGLKAAKTTSNVTEVLEEVRLQAALVLDLRRDGFSPELRARLAEEVKGKVSKQRGLNNEDSILNTYEAAREVKVIERNTKTIKKDFGTFKLVGRCDGYVASENRIVDSKDRTRMWPTVPLYDEIQLRCYMNMYGATESELIERFPTGQTRHTLYTADPEKWASLQTSLERAVAKLKAAVEDEEELKRIVAAATVCTQSNGSAASLPVPSRVVRSETLGDL